MRRLLLSGILLALLGAVLWAAPNAWSAPLSKRYEFKDGVILEMAARATSGLRLDTVRFRVPAPRVSSTDSAPTGSRRVGVESSSHRCAPSAAAWSATSP